MGRPLEAPICRSNATVPRVGFGPPTLILHDLRRNATPSSACCAQAHGCVQDLVKVHRPPSDLPAQAAAAKTRRRVAAVSFSKRANSSSGNSSHGGGVQDGDGEDEECVGGGCKAADGAGPFPSRRRTNVVLKHYQKKSGQRGAAAHSAPPVWEHE
jgi:hypothetical protein